MERWATFDCYGTLVDWETGMASAIRTIARNQQGLLRAYYEIEAMVEAEAPFRRYHEVLAETLRRAARQEGVTLKPGAESVLADTLPDWPVFADVRPALTRLRESGWKLAILSNVDRDLIAGTQRRLAVPFDDVITAEEVRSYKPGLAHFQRFRERRSPSDGGWVHVARSWFHDIQPAGTLGIPSVWINRGGETRDPAPATAVLADLTDLPATLARLASGVAT